MAVPRPLLGILSIHLMIVLISSCTSDTSPRDTHGDDPVIAMVGNRTLHTSDLSAIIHPQISATDSIALAAAYIDQWVDDQLLTREAAKRYSDDIDIDRLVLDYREQLFKIHLEEEIISDRFDPTIQQYDLDGFYESIKSQFLLDHSIYRVWYLKVSRDQDNLKDLITSWNDNKLTKIKTFAYAFGEEQQLDSTQWMTWEDLEGYASIWSQSRANQHKSQRQRDDKYEYFLKVMDHVDKEEIAPLSYIKPQLTKMILHRRRQSILETYKQELYEVAINQNQIKFPTSDEN
jgi:hypothetical protein